MYINRIDGVRVFAASQVSLQH